MDKFPRQVYATLLDEGEFHCSVRDMYRILTSEHGNINECRPQVQRPIHTKPELLATALPSRYGPGISQVLKALSNGHISLCTCLCISLLVILSA